jgi:hypothetical protein
MLAKEVEHFFLNLLAICASFEKCLLDSLVLLLIGLFVPLVF